MEDQLVAEQRLAVAAVCVAVLTVPGQGTAYACQLGTNLVGAPGVQFYLQQRPVRLGAMRWGAGASYKVTLFFFSSLCR